MNIYVIYKFSDAKQVNALLEDCKSKDKDGILHFFKFSPSKKVFGWHKIAKNKMRQCNIVCYFCTITDKDNIKLKNVSWELKLASKLNKTVVIFTLNPKMQPRLDNTALSIYGVDFSGELIDIEKYKTIPSEDAFAFLYKEATWNVADSLINTIGVANLTEDAACHSDHEIQKNNDLLLEQYRIMVETSEKLMDRRQNTSNLYTTLCSALVALVGASFAFGNFSIVGIVSFLVGFILTFLCINWRSCLKSYDMNNAGKFAVLNAIEKILPANMFDSEYRYNTKNGIRSYSSRERILPIIFLIFGIIMIIFGIGVGIYFLI